MSSDWTGIYRAKLYSTVKDFPKKVVVNILECVRYIRLTLALPWEKMAEVADRYRSQVVDTRLGRSLDLRLHLGMVVCMLINGWPLRVAEEMLRFHAGVRILCGVEATEKTLDHTSMFTFLKILGAQGIEEINVLIIGVAHRLGFTTPSLSASDTTIQEAPIAHPTEVGHMKRIVEKLSAIGKKIKKGISSKVVKIKTKATDTFGKIRLFTSGKVREVLQRKKELTKKMHSLASELLKEVKKEIKKMSPSSREKYVEQMAFFQKMLSQIRYWIKKGHHPKGKILSLWNHVARAFSRGNGKRNPTTKFGVQWLISRLSRGYLIGKICPNPGKNNDKQIAIDILQIFQETFGTNPKRVVYDRGADTNFNHQTLKDANVKDCIFRNGPKGTNTEALQRDLVSVRKARSLTEASIATIKSAKYGFSKPRAKSASACQMRGQMAILGANLQHLTTDLTAPQNLGVWKW